MEYRVYLIMNDYKQYFSHLNEDYNKTAVISQLLDLGYTIDEIVNILDNTAEDEVVNVLDDFVKNKNRYAIYERWEEMFGNEKRR